jgi:hypothetical protein
MSNSAPQKKSVDAGKTKRAKGTKILLLVHGCGHPLVLDYASVSPVEVKLIEHLLNQRVLPRYSDRLIYDRTAHSPILRTELAERQV